MDPRIEVVSDLELDLPVKNTLNRVCELYKDTIEKVVVLPNITTAVDGSISGFVAHFAQNAPVFPELMDTNNFLTGGVSVFPILEDSGTAFLHPSRQPHRSLLEAVHSNVGAPFSLQSRDPTTNRDKKDFVYTTDLGEGEHASAGIQSMYSSVDGREHRFIVVNAGVPKLSSDIVSYVNSKVTRAPAKALENSVKIYTGARAVESKLSMEEFANSEMVKYGQNAGTRLRGAIAAQIADKFKLRIPLVRDMSSSDGRMIGVPLIDQRNFALSKSPEGGFVLYSNAVSTEKANNGLCMSLAPTLGTLIFQRGLSSGALHSWTNDYCNAFPASVARTMAPHRALEKVSNANTNSFAVGSPVTHAFCWPASGSEFNDKMLSEAYQARGENFKRAEFALGKDIVTGSELHLRPILMDVPSSASVSRK